MKKFITLIATALAFGFTFTLNFNALNNSREFSSLEKIISIPEAQASTGEDQGGGYKRCDYEGGLGIPFWDRTCNDCKLHFNAWYDGGYTCYHP